MTKQQALQAAKRKQARQRRKHLRAVERNLAPQLLRVGFYEYDTRAIYQMDCMTCHRPQCRRFCKVYKHGAGSLKTSDPECIECALKRHLRDQGVPKKMVDAQIRVPR